MFDRVQLLAIVAGAAGGAVAIGAMEAFSAATAFPLAAIPFATSIVMVLGMPDAPPAQPRALIGGHLVSTLAGLVILKLCGPAPWAAAVAVGLAMIAMHLTGTFHPPAGIDPLVVVVNKHAMELSRRARRRRRAAARGVRLWVAQHDGAAIAQARGLAGTVVVRS
jgi:CBS-domain-containing membrane protein